MKTKLNLPKTALAALCAIALSSTPLFAGNKVKTAEEQGIIKSVDANSHYLVITDQKTKTEKSFQWNDQTKFTGHDKIMSVSSLLPGTAIRLAYEPGTGTPMLKAVKLSPAKVQTHSSASTSKHHSAPKS